MILDRRDIIVPVSLIARPPSAAVFDVPIGWMPPPTKGSRHFRRRGQIIGFAGDRRHWDLVQAVADFASPTGQWPEAIHPRTRGGCMGDGQHVWVSAEWILMFRNCFVREEGDRLILCSGVPPRWLEAGQTIRFGPTATLFGPLTVEIEPGDEARVRWSAEWRGASPQVEITDGFAAGDVDARS